MAPKLTLLLGGARSGKSRKAEELAGRMGERVLYVATAQALDGEMQDRIAAHRRSRPASWETVEAPSGVGEAVRAALATGPADAVLLDCVTLLVSNSILAGSADEDPERIDEEAARARVAAEIDGLLETIASSDVPWILVSNETGMGLVPPYRLGRVYRDLLGWANQRLAEEADSVLLLVAGIPVDIKALASASGQLPV